MRTRLILGVVVLVVLIPQAASAICGLLPFDHVVQSSDAVLVGTVAAAEVTNEGIVVQLDVEQTLKGSTQDGQRVLVTSCGPMITASMARENAQAMVGDRRLFLLTRNADGTFSEFPEFTKPNLSLDDSITRARQVLGLAPAPTVHDPNGTIPTWKWASVVLLIMVGIGGLIAGAVFVIRHARHA